MIKRKLLGTISSNSSKPRLGKDSPSTNHSENKSAKDSSLKVLFASSEVWPLMKTGGLADVAYNLPKALAQLGHDIRVVMPCYKDSIRLIKSYRKVATITLNKQEIDVIETQLSESNLSVWLIADPVFSSRAGNPYSNSYNSEWPDNAERFTLFCQAVSQLALDQAGLNWQPDIVHCNDWQTGLVPVYLSLHNHRPATVFTVHNLAYQGLFSYEVFKTLGLDDSFWRFDTLEFHNQLSFIKGGLVYSDRINTVSPNYARELLTEEYGCGLSGLFIHRGEQFIGILNGIDQETWNPVTDSYLSENYSSLKSSHKQFNKVFLRQRFGLSEDSDSIVISWVGRLVEQKGVNLLIASMPKLLELPVQIVILGSGDDNIHVALKELSDQYPEQLAVAIGYSEALAHQIIGGSDYFLMPSRFEPCGLTQLYSLRYGTLPIAANVGGLVDTITNTTEQTIADKTATGFLFDGDDRDELINTVSKAIELYRNKPLYRSIQLCAMQQDFSWKESAKQYVSIYRSLFNQSPAAETL